MGISAVCVCEDTRGVGNRLVLLGEGSDIQNRRWMEIILIKEILLMESFQQGQFVSFAHSVDVTTEIFS